MEHPYSVKITYKAKKGTWPAFRGEIYERDILIGKCSRAPLNGWVPPIEFKFFSSQAQARFDDFADCLSIGESIEAILPF
jgi:hypothetical protein